MSGENAITEERLKRVAGRAQDGRDEVVVYDDESSKSLCWRGPVPIAQVVGALVLMNCASKRLTTTRLGVYRACDAAGMVAGGDGMRVPVIELEASVVTCRIAPSPACMNK